VDDVHHGYSMDAIAWETLNFGNMDYQMLEVLGGGYTIDWPLIGARVGGVLVSSRVGSVRVLTPTAGVRVGSLDRGGVTADLALPDVFVYNFGDEGRSLTSSYDLRVRATLPIKPYLRLEARGRFRNAFVQDEIRQHDWLLAVGVQGRLASHNLEVNGLPVFIGVGVRELRRHDEGRLHPISNTVVLSVDLAVGSSQSKW
jgi:hypothetical protein